MATATLDGSVPQRSTGWLVALLALAVLLLYVDRGAIGIAAPLMKDELHLSATGFGLAVSAFFWAYAPLNLVVGWLCDRYCVYRLFASGVALWALSTVLTGWVGMLATLIVLRVLLGVGESIAFPGSSKIFASEVPVAGRGMANAAIAAAIAFGPAVGTLAGGALMVALGWREMFWVFGAVTLLWLVPWTLASRPFRAPRFAVSHAAPHPFGPLLRIRALWLMGLAHFASNYCFYFTLTWLPLYLVKTRGYSVAEMTGIATAGFIAQGLSALALGRLSDHLVTTGRDEGAVRRALITAGQVAVAIAVAGIALTTSREALLGWLVLAGIGTGPVSTNIFAIGQIFAGPRAAGGWIGVQNTIGNTSGIVGPIITGLIVDRLGGYGWAFAVASLVAAAGAVLWGLIIPPIRQVCD